MVTSLAIDVGCGRQTWTTRWRPCRPAASSSSNSTTFSSFNRTHHRADGSLAQHPSGATTKWRRSPYKGRGIGAQKRDPRFVVVVRGTARAGQGRGRRFKGEQQSPEADRANHVLADAEAYWSILGKKRAPWFRAAGERLADQPSHGWKVHLARRPARMPRRSHLRHLLQHANFVGSTFLARSRSISWEVVERVTLKRMASLASSRDRPIERRVGKESIAPAWHADPSDAAMRRIERDASPVHRRSKRWPCSADGTQRRRSH